MDGRPIEHSTVIATANGHEPYDLDHSSPNGASSALVSAKIRTELLEAFGDLIDQPTGAIGRVVGSEREPAGSHVFHFWADDKALTVDVGHIIVAFSEEAAVIGVVDEPRRFSDLRSFLDDYFDRHLLSELEDESPTRRPEMLVFKVNVLATKHLRSDVDSHRPPVSGPVFFATKAAISYALGVDEFSGTEIPALMHVNGNYERDEKGEIKRDEKGREVFQRAPIFIDEEYLVGPEAGHANWTGQSGLATKTSHALFLTSAIFQTLRQKERPTSVAALMFNVKGPDLLWLDKPCDPDPDDPDAVAAYQQAGVRALSDLDREAYEALGLEPKPFGNLKIFAPFKPHQEPQPSGGKDGAQVVYLNGAIDRAKLNTLRDDSSAAVGTVFPILWPLERILWAPHKVFERGDLDDKLWGFIFDIRERRIGSLSALEKLFDDAEREMEEKETHEWQGHHKFTLRKARNRFRSLPSKLGGLLAQGEVSYGDAPKVDNPFTDQELRVVDIAGCNSNVQEMIVSSVIHQVWKMAEEEKLGVNKLIVFVDELNKYAPNGGEGGLRDTLVDIAARGRHLNVVLFGAQQFRSKVDSEILGNCGTSLYGRVGDEEMVNSAYRSLSETVKAELLGLPKGRLLVRHAHFRSPLFGTFPFPPTITGMKGQNLFNAGGTQLGTGTGQAGNAVVALTHPADGIWNLMRHVLGEGKGPSKAEVRRECADLSKEIIDRVCVKLDAGIQQNRRNTRYNPWGQAKNLIAQERVYAGLN